MNNFDNVLQHLRTSTNIRSLRDLSLVIGEPLQDIFYAKGKGVFPSEWLAKIVLLRPGSFKGLGAKLS